MNKKHLSVVMAGAMLATSVAPVLADTTVAKYELAADQKGLLMSGLRDLLTKKFQSKDVKAGQNVYYYKVSGDSNTYTSVDHIKNSAVKAGSVITVYDEGHREENGNFYSTAKDAVPGKTVKYTEAILEAHANAIHNNLSSYPVIKDASYKDGVLTVTLKKLDEKLNKNVELTYTVNDNARAFANPIDASKAEIANNADNSQEVVDFAEYVEPGTAAGADIKGGAIAEITLTAESNDFLVEDLFDGVMLTEKGHDILSNMKAATSINVSSVSPANGVYSFDARYTTKEGENVRFAVRGLNKDNADTLRNWLAAKDAKVDLLAGSNRFETAVKIAKENAGIKDVAVDGNIVLVNGNSLVDGLAAAPLAASVVNYGHASHKVAPILLTNTDGIPKETKAYMKEVIGQQQVQNLGKVTVYLVGGEAVISPAVENDLKDMGLRVVRAGGKDREATSLEVAKLMNNKETAADPKKAFVVGADGEADAMSVAAVAAEQKSPIIVESRKGLSKEAVEYLKGETKTDIYYNTSKEATIVGGEAVVSKETEKMLKDKEIKVNRIAGANRQATNAAVIEKYYTKFAAGRNVIVAKDGQKNKSELIDALTATSLAAEKKAPIVLATDKLSNAQINALELRADKAAHVYQVGYGVNRNVVKTVAQRLGLLK